MFVTAKKRLPADSGKAWNLGNGWDHRSCWHTSTYGGCS